MRRKYYTLLYTPVSAPDGSTPETGDSATGWANIGTIQYAPGADDLNFTGYPHHRFDISQGGSPVAATGIRFKVSDVGTCIDEIEVNPIPNPVPPIADFIELTPAAGFGIVLDLNEGKYSTPSSPAPVPANDAATSRVSTPFTNTDLGPALAARRASCVPSPWLRQTAIARVDFALREAQGRIGLKKRPCPAVCFPGPSAAIE